MTCNWDKTWSPGTEILPCDWVACLEPPHPPEYANLLVTDWFGDPIQFGDKVTFVCERGMKFEDEPEKKYEEYQCQNGSLPGTERGYFKIPEDDKWPRCVKGPLCIPPPDAPFEGFINISSPVHDVEIIDACQVDGEDLEIVCPSFLNIHIRSATYGRKANTKTVCTGVKDRGPSEDCLDTEVLNTARSLCHGNYSCSIAVSGSLADLSLNCNTKKKELNITHTCGNNDYVLNYTKFCPV